MQYHLAYSMELYFHILNNRNPCIVIHIVLPASCLCTALPIMHLQSMQIVRLRFRWVMIVAANVTSSRDKERNVFVR